MGSHKKGALPSAESKNAEARRPSTSPTTPANNTVMQLLAQERDLHRSQTAEMLSDMKTRAEEIANVIARAERMADATMRPLRVWDEAAAVLEEREDADVKQEDDTELAWALGEAADICEMFLQNATGAEERNDKIVERIDGLLAALNANEM